MRDMSAPVVIAVVNHKGGCAKTTTAVNLASALAVGNEQMGVSGRRVLLVDLDPKGNVATTFGIDKRSLGPTMNELFKGGVDGAPVTLNECLLGPENLTEAMRAAWKLHNPERKRDLPRTSPSTTCGCCPPTSTCLASRSISPPGSDARIDSNWLLSRLLGTSTWSSSTPRPLWVC